MKLTDYLTRVDMSRDQFAAAIGVDVVTVGRYITGARRPSWDVLKRIREVTSAQVTADDFLDVDETAVGEQSRADFRAA